ncbi:MAG: FAD:protein FMN transferase, partial [Myxococcota bacterium]
MARPSPPGDDGPGALRRFVLPMIFVIALFVALFMRRPDGGSGDPSELWTITGPIMGTTFTVKVLPKEVKTDRDTTEKAIQEALNTVNAQMSTYQKDSELSQFNANPSTEPIAISPELALVTAEALRLNTLSGGAFDVTVGPLVNAWGFGPDTRGKPPSEETLAQLKQRVGADKISLNTDGPTLTKAHPEVYVDLSAIAKGHGVDQVAKTLDTLGYNDYMVEVGGEVRAHGVNAEGKPWRIGIEKPDENARAIQEVVALDNMALATSGNYRNFYEDASGKRISHTIDPVTGRPVTHRLASVSVLHPSCMTADGLATALNVLGDTKGYTWAAKENLAALFIIKDPEGRFLEKATPAF